MYEICKVRDVFYRFMIGEYLLVKMHWTDNVLVGGVDKMDQLLQMYLVKVKQCH